NLFLLSHQPVLWDLIQRDDNSSALRVLLQVLACTEYTDGFLIPLFCFLCQASQKELQAMETMTAAFIHKFPRVTPELFVDLSQFIPFMSVSDIMSFPRILFNVKCVTSPILTASVLPFRLTAIRDHSSGMKSLQKKAFVKRLLQSSVVGDVPTWPPYFLSSILPLLPYLPISHFQQLTSQQVRGHFTDLKSYTFLINIVNNNLPLTCRSLGQIAGGMSCDFLRLWINDTDFAELLQFVSELPGGTRPALVRNKLQQCSNSLSQPPKWSHKNERAVMPQMTSKTSLWKFLLASFHRIHSSFFFFFCAVPVPSCADIRGTFPSAWTPTQLNRMSQEELKLCVEVFGGDSSLSSEQRRSLWVKLKQSFSPVRELRADQVLMLGSVVTEMGERELQDANLTDPGVLAHLGTLTDWSPKKTRAVILSVMRKRKLKAEQLTAVDLAHFGHLICGLYPSEMKRLSSYNLSMAVLFLRDTSLPCTEQQMEALTSCLSRPEAFGPVSAWGPEVFTEIGTLAAGLPDLVLSALLQEQVEGITPEAVALMQPKKMAVVFSAVQLSWLSVEQAWAVTDEQWAELDTEQRHAVGLARYEGDVLLELRGVSVEKSINFLLVNLLRVFLNFHDPCFYATVTIMCGVFTLCSSDSTGRNSAPAALSTDSLTLCSLALCLSSWQLI
uniref:Stereocilin LRR domain-containing protein n=1 Tax=Amphiprion ocellaris TaxID=80972 RepID=A0AAQ5XBI9_AMPOC